MKKIALIGLVVAATLGGGFLIFKKSKPAPRDEEILPAPPMAQEAAELKTVEPEAPVPVDEAPVEQPSQPEPSRTKAKPKAASGHFGMSRPTAHDDHDPNDNPGFGKAREKRLWEIFQSDRDLVRSIKVKSIRCRVDTCIVEATSKDGDADRFQSLMFALTKQYPWLGNKIDVTTPENNPLAARFVYFHEVPK